MNMGSNHWNSNTNTDSLSQDYTHPDDLITNTWVQTIQTSDTYQQSFSRLYTPRCTTHQHHLHLGSNHSNLRHVPTVFLKTIHAQMHNTSTSLTPGFKPNHELQFAVLSSKVKGYCSKCNTVIPFDAHVFGSSISKSATKRRKFLNRLFSKIPMRLDAKASLSLAGTLYIASFFKTKLPLMLLNSKYLVTPLWINILTSSPRSRQNYTHKNGRLSIIAGYQWYRAVYFYLLQIIILCPRPNSDVDLLPCRI